MRIGRSTMRPSRGDPAENQPIDYVYVYIYVYYTYRNILRFSVVWLKPRQLKHPMQNNVPKDILTLWNKAVQSNCKAAKSMLFAKWMENGKEWMTLAGCTKESFRGPLYLAT